MSLDLNYLHHASCAFCLLLSLTQAQICTCLRAVSWTCYPLYLRVSIPLSACGMSSVCLASICALCIYVCEWCLSCESDLYLYLVISSKEITLFVEQHTKEHVGKDILREFYKGLIHCLQLTPTGPDWTNTKHIVYQNMKLPSVFMVNFRKLHSTPVFTSFSKWYACIIWIKNKKCT